MVTYQHERKGLAQRCRLTTPLENAEGVHRHPHKEVGIRGWTVGLIAIAALAAAGLLLTRRRPEPAVARARRSTGRVDDFYAAGL